MLLTWQQTIQPFPPSFLGFTSVWKRLIKYGFWEVIEKFRLFLKYSKWLPSISSISQLFSMPRSNGSYRRNQWAVYRFWHPWLGGGEGAFCVDDMNWFQDIILSFVCSDLYDRKSFYGYDMKYIAILYDIYYTCTLIFWYLLILEHYAQKRHFLFHKFPILLTPPPLFSAPRCAKSDGNLQANRIISVRCVFSQVEASYVLVIILSTLIMYLLSFRMLFLLRQCYENAIL